ncbi:VOC family protein [Amycolatopsis antarctica]|uniref:VOC family protein n=1 Tax=Amycolatopsis antarctica TaxID=1854586 RepID=UPI001F0B660B|nr:VOC family protein [Amycolatopsis antarctica]
MTETANRRLTLHAYFNRDAPAALRWLERVFGFTTTVEFADEHGGVVHAELRREGAGTIVFSDDNDYERCTRRGETVGHGVYLSVATETEVHAIHEAAVDAGATVVWKPEATEWGCTAAEYSIRRATNGASARCGPARAPPKGRRTGPEPPPAQRR